MEILRQKEKFHRLFSVSDKVWRYCKKWQLYERRYCDRRDPSLPNWEPCQAQDHQNARCCVFQQQNNWPPGDPHSVRGNCSPRPDMTTFTSQTSRLTNQQSQEARERLAEADKQQKDLACDSDSADGYSSYCSNDPLLLTYPDPCLVSTEPRTVAHAQNSSNRNQWEFAMDAELKMAKRNVCTVVKQDSVSNIRTISANRVYTRKIDGNTGGPSKYKARCAYKGHRPVKGVNWDDVTELSAHVGDLPIILSKTKLFDGRFPTKASTRVLLVAADDKEPGQCLAPVDGTERSETKLSQSQQELPKLGVSIVVVKRSGL